MRRQIAFTLSSFILFWALPQARAQLVEGSYAKKAQFHYKEGTTLLSQQEYLKAIDELNTAIAYDATLADAYLDRATARKAIGDLQGAHTDLGIYLELRPNEPEALFERGTIRFALGLYNLAREDFLTLQKIPPAVTAQVFYQLDAHGRVNDIFTTQAGIPSTIYNYLGLIAFKLGDPVTSVAYYDSAIVGEPSNADYYVNKAQSYQAMDDSYHAMQAYASALKLDPDNAVVRYDMGVAAASTGHGDSARKYFDDAIDKDPARPEMYAERGYIRLIGEDLPGALSDYSEAIKLDPSNPDYWFNRGLCREKLSKFTAAYDDFSQALKIKEGFDRGWMERGNVLVKMGKYEEAIDDYTAAILYRPGYGLAFYNRAVARQRTHDSADACADLKQAISLGVDEAKTMQQKICPPK